MELTRELVEDITLFLGAVIAIFSVLAALTSFAAKIVVAARRYRRNRRPKSLLLLYPTPEDLAKYCVKMPQKILEDERIYERTHKFENESDLEFVEIRYRIRIGLIAIAFGLAFLVIAVRFIIVSLF